MKIQLKGAASGLKGEDSGSVTGARVFACASNWSKGLGRAGWRSVMVKATGGCMVKAAAAKESCSDDLPVPPLLSYQSI